MMRHLRTALVLFLFCALPATALEPPWYGASLSAGHTGNLFGDSLAQGDQYAALGLSLQQQIGRSLVAWYAGAAEGYRDQRDLGSLRHQGGVDAGMFLGSRGELWGSVSGLWLGYGDAYDTYNRRTLQASGGTSWILSPAVRLRGQLDAADVAYPLAADTLDVDYRRFSVRAGVNLALTLPLSLDLEAGAEGRAYHELTDPATTMFFWVTARASRPLARNLGLAVSTTLREQNELENAQILSLYRGGLDPSSMLWDGVQGEVKLTRVSGPWRQAASVALQRAEYAGSLGLVATDPRRDSTVSLAATVVRQIPLRENWPSLSLSLDLSWTANRSTEDYYDYTSSAASLTLGLMAP